MIKKIIFLLALIFLSSGVFAANETIDGKALAEKCLSDSRAIMVELANANFSIQRINDTIKIANDLYASQVAREGKKVAPDYTSVMDYCNSIQKIKSDAYTAKDLIYSLTKTYTLFYSEMSGAGANTSSIDILMNQVNQEMVDERYEKVIEEVPAIESKIVEVQASATTFNLFYSSISRGLKEWFVDNRYYILGFFVLILLGALIYKFKLKRYFVEKKIASLSSEKKVIQEMIRSLQKVYFESGKISESEYNIKTKKFAELIRDIERQIPLYQEELAKLDAKRALEIEKTNKIFKNVKLAKKSSTSKKAKYVFKKSRVVKKHRRK